MYIINKINRFHGAVHQFSNSSQTMSKCGTKQKSGTQGNSSDLCKHVYMYLVKKMTQSEKLNRCDTDMYNHVCTKINHCIVHQTTKVADIILTELLYLLFNRECLVKKEVCKFFCHPVCIICILVAPRWSTTRQINIIIIITLYFLIKPTFYSWTDLWIAMLV